MSALRSHIALFLLLCLTRTLLPEAWVLGLHPHEHTTEEAAFAPGFAKGKLLLGKQHQHCVVEHFYDVAYQAAAPVLLPVPGVAVRYACCVAARAERGALGQETAVIALRGPPVRGNS